jgi:hypothetical protein
MTSSVGSLVLTSAAAVSRNTNDDEPSANVSRAPTLPFGDVRPWRATRPPHAATLRAKSDRAGVAVLTLLPAAVGRLSITGV